MSLTPALHENIIQLNFLPKERVYFNESLRTYSFWGKKKVCNMLPYFSMAETQGRILRH